MTELIALIRGLVEDLLSKGDEIFTFDSEYVFPLTESNIVAVSKVTINANDLETGESYTFDTDTNRVSLVASLSSGDVIRIYYTFYNQYSDTEIKGYILSALSWLSICKYRNSTWASNVDDFVVKNSTILPQPTTAEERLIALVASIVINPNVSYRTPDLGITIRDSEPKEEKIRKVIRGFKSRLGVFDIIEKDTE